MFRTSVIVATVIAILLGSLGLPATAHACRMMKSVTPVACGACGADHTSVQSQQNGDNGARIGATPCCTTTRTHQTISSAVMMEKQAQVIISVVATVVASNLLYRDELSRDGRPAHECFKPPLHRRGQDTYLFNSLFLI